MNREQSANGRSRNAGLDQEFAAIEHSDTNMSLDVGGGGTASAGRRQSNKPLQRYRISRVECHDLP